MNQIVKTSVYVVELEKDLWNNITESEKKVLEFKHYTL